MQCRANTDVHCAIVARKQHARRGRPFITNCWKRINIFMFVDFIAMRNRFSVCIFANLRAFPPLIGQMPRGKCQKVNDDGRLHAPNNFINWIFQQIAFIELSNTLHFPCTRTPITQFPNTFNWCIKNALFKMFTSNIFFLVPDLIQSKYSNEALQI